jgi:hypothetical protein
VSRVIFLSVAQHGVVLDARCALQVLEGCSPGREEAALGIVRGMVLDTLGGRRGFATFPEETRGSIVVER